MATKARKVVRTTYTQGNPQYKALGKNFSDKMDIPAPNISFTTSKTKMVTKRNGNEKWTNYPSVVDGMKSGMKKEVYKTNAKTGVTKRKK